MFSKCSLNIYFCIFSPTHFKCTNSVQMKIYGCCNGQVFRVCLSWPKVGQDSIESYWNVNPHLQKTPEFSCGSLSFAGTLAPLRHKWAGTKGTTWRNKRHECNWHPLKNSPEEPYDWWMAAAWGIGFASPPMDCGDKAVFVVIRGIPWELSGRPLNARWEASPNPQYQLPVRGKKSAGVRPRLKHSYNCLANISLLTLK